MNPFLQAMLNGLAGTLEAAGESLLLDALQKMHNSNIVRYKAFVFGVYAGCLELDPIVEGTDTKIDDAFLHALRDAVNASAKMNGITLTEPAQ